MGLFDRFKKKNQEEEAVQEKNTAQDTAEEQVRDPEDAGSGPDSAGTGGGSAEMFRGK